MSSNTLSCDTNLGWYEESRTACVGYTNQLRYGHVRVLTVKLPDLIWKGRYCNVVMSLFTFLL